MTSEPANQRRIPSLNWLRVFEAAARTESFARAAELLNISAPAISQQIRALEGYLGKPLFARGPQKVALTDAGRAFLPVVQQALAAVETGAAALFGADDEQSVTLQAVTVLAMSWLPACLEAFEAAHPGVRVNVITGNTLADFRTVLPGREPDLQIAFGSVIDFPRGAVPLFGETLFMVAAPKCARAIATPDDLARYRLLDVAQHRAGWHQVLAQLPGADLRHMRLAMVDTTPLALMIAAQGLGVALARAPATDNMVAALGLERLALSPEVRGLERYVLLRPEARPPSRAALWLFDWLAAYRGD